MQMVAGQVAKLIIRMIKLSWTWLRLTIGVSFPTSVIKMRSSIRSNDDKECQNVYTDKRLIWFNWRSAHTTNTQTNFLIILQSKASFLLLDKKHWLCNLWRKDSLQRAIKELCVDCFALSFGAQISVKNVMCDFLRNRQSEVSVNTKHLIATSKCFSDKSTTTLIPLQSVRWRMSKYERKFALQPENFYDGKNSDFHLFSI